MVNHTLRVFFPLKLNCDFFISFSFLIESKPKSQVYQTSPNYNFVIKTAVKLGDHAEVGAVVELRFCWHTIPAKLPAATEWMVSCFKLKYSSALQIVGLSFVL